jgi:aspartate aminotransferase-like enzyme
MRRLDAHDGRRGRFARFLHYYVGLILLGEVQATDPAAGPAAQVPDLRGILKKFNANQTIDPRCSRDPRPQGFDESRSGFSPGASIPYVHPDPRSPIVNLRSPGPTPCPQDVLQAMGRQMIHHRSPEFAGILNRVTDGLKQVFETKDDVYCLTASGTGALEAMVVNFLSPGDRVLVVSIGVFGDRFATIAKTYGVDVTKVDFEWGTAADPQAVTDAMRKAGALKAVLVTHNETSTGVTNDLEAIASAVRAQQPDVLLLVDAISSLGSIRCPVDGWQLDVVATGSQKGWMVPPGLAMVSVSEPGWRAYEQSKMPRFYFDLGKAKEFLAKGQTPWTPAISIFFALDVALKHLTAEGVDGIVARHQRIADLTRQGMKSLGLQLLAGERHASNTVTAVRVPDGVEWAKLYRMLQDDYDTLIEGGQGPLAGKIFRIGHLGFVTDKDISDTIETLRAALPRLGYKLPEAARAG